MRRICALASPLRIVLGLAILAFTPSPTSAEAAGVRFGGPPLTLVMTVDIGAHAFPPQGRAELAVADDRDEVIFQGPVHYRMSNSQLRVAHPVPPTKMPLIRDRVRVTLVVNDRQGTQRTFRAAAANPRLPVTPVADAPSKTLLLARGDATPESRRTLTVKVVGGRVKSSPPGIDCSGKEKSCTHAFPFDFLVILRADGPGGRVAWTGCAAASAGNECILKMDQPELSVTATFPPPTRPFAAPNRVVVRVTGPGTVTSSPASISCRDKAGKGCEETFKQDTVNLTLTPDPGYVVAVGCPAGQMKCTVTHKLDGRSELNVVFKAAVPDLVRLTVNVSGGGAVRIKDSDRPPCVSSGCSYGVPRGEPVTLVAEAGARQRLKDWGGGCQPHKRELRCLVTLTRSETVDAVFERNPFSIGVKAGRGLVVSVTPPGSLPGGQCREACEVFFQSQTPVVLEARKAQPEGENSAEAPSVEWTGCDSHSGFRCSITQARAQTVSVAPKAGWVPILRLLGLLIVLLPVGYWALRRLILWWPGLNPDASRQRDLDKRARRVMADPAERSDAAAQIKRETSRPLSTGSSAQGPRSLPQPVLDDLLQQNRDHEAHAWAGPQSGSGIEPATQAGAPTDMADDEAMMVAAINVEWRQILAGGALDRPALRERLQRFGLRGDFYDPRNFVERLETLVQLPYTFTPAPTTGSWLLVQTFPSCCWLALPLTHALITDTAIAVMKLLFRGWDKPPARYRFERAYRPCVFGQVAGAGLSFELQRKGYFTLEGAPASPAPPPAPQSYEMLVGTSAERSGGVVTPATPMIATPSTSSRWEPDVDVAGTPVLMDSGPTQRPARSYERPENVTAATHVVATPLPDIRVDDLLERLENRLDAGLHRTGQMLKKDIETQANTLADLRLEVAELRNELRAGLRTANRAEPAASQEGRDKERANEAGRASRSVAFPIPRWMSWLLQPSADMDPASTADAHVYLQLLRDRVASTRPLAQHEPNPLEIDIVHLDAISDDSFAVSTVTILDDPDRALRCLRCDKLPGAMTYQHFVAARNRDGTEVAVFLPAGGVVVREQWPRGFSLLLEGSPKTRLFLVASVEQGACLRRKPGKGDGYRVISPMRVALVPGTP